MIDLSNFALGDLSQFGGIDFSICLVFVGAILYYFGRIISDSNVELSDKRIFYVNGFIFSVWFILLPFIMIYSIFISPYQLFDRVESLLAIYLQITLNGMLSHCVKAHYFLRRGDILPELKKRLEKPGDHIVHLKKLEEFTGEPIERSMQKTDEFTRRIFGLSYVEFGVMCNYEIPIKVIGNRMALFLSAFFMLYTDYYLFIQGNLIEWVVAFILTFFNFTLIANIYGYNKAYYPTVKVYMDNKLVKGGKLLKVGDYIHLLHNNKNIFINPDKVRFIEKNVFKEKDLYSRIFGESLIKKYFVHCFRQGIKFRDFLVGNKEVAK